MSQKINQSGLLSDIKILVVEDDESLLALIRRIIEKNKVYTYGAVRGKEAISLIESEDIDMILLDYKLPDVKIQSVIDAINKQDKHMPFIVMTGYGDVKNAVSMMKLGASDYLVKDINFLELFPSVVNKAIDDLATKKQLEQTTEVLWQTDQTLSSIIKDSPLAIFTLNLQSQVVLWSPSAEEMFGFRKDNVLGQELPIHPECEDDQCRHKMEKLLQGEGFTGFVAKCKKADGTTIDVSISTAPLYDKDKKIFGAMGIVEDISEKVRLMQQIRAHTEELEERVASRTSELRAVNKELNSFASIISHDLKAPLRAISQLAMWISMDYEKVLDDNGKELLDLLLGRVKRMDGLIEGILEYSKVGHKKEKEENIDLNESLRSVLDLLSPPSHINVTIENQMPTIYCSKVRIEQVFQNLISNAIKFLDKPQGEIKIGCKNDGSHWIFYVSDNGPGINEKYFEKVFQIFQTLSPRDSYESTGIGLTLVQKIVELYGGRVWVESEEGKGSTFLFTFAKT